MQTLFVYLNSDKIGHIDLLDNKKDFIFQYSSEWLANPHAVAISLNLPLQVPAFDADKTRAFFRNILPEADIRKTVARNLQISEKNDFALLEALGGECAGAIFISPIEIPPNNTPNYQALTETELYEKIASLHSSPFFAGEKGLRLSLAGAQNKLPVYLKNNKIYLPLDNSPSSHILKIPIKDLNETVANEAFCMTLAKLVGLAVSDVIYYQAIEPPLYLVKRYDRHYENGQLIRLHQEDFCQALGIAPELKYEKEGGPSLSDCFNLIKQYSTKPAFDIRMLIKWVIFNYLIGNADAHGKNLALLITKTGIQLAPFYDLISTHVYDELTPRFAMKIGGENRPKWIMERHWIRFAKEIDISTKLIFNTLGEMVNILPNTAIKLANEYQNNYGTIPILEKIIKVIETQARNVLNINQTIQKIK
jgi:serine/threonine-protein kinase HipA